MDPERILRISFGGWALAVSFLLHFWLFAGDAADLLPKWTLADRPLQAAATLFAGLATTPIFGLAISSWTRRALWCSYYFLPSTHREIPLVFGALSSLLPQGVMRSELDSIVNKYATAASSDLRHLQSELEPYLTFVFHGTSGPLVDFCARRWTLYRMWANLTVAIGVGAILALVMRAWTDIGRGMAWQPDCVRMSVEAVVLLAIAPAFWQMPQLRGEIKSVFRIWLFSASNVQPASSE